MIYWQLFISFLQVGLFSIGGGYASLPIIQSRIVEQHGWLDMAEFTDLITIAEMTPGPIALNAATFVGTRIGGLPGALAATFGCIFPALILVSLLAFVYYRYKKLTVVQSVLGSLRPVVVALIASAGLGIMLSVAFGGRAYAPENLDIAGVVLFVLALAALRKLKTNPILTMAACGAVYTAVHLIVP